MDEQKKENSSMLDSIISTPSNSIPELETETKKPIFTDNQLGQNSTPQPPKKPKMKKTPQEILRIFGAIFLAGAVLFGAFISYIVFNPENARFFISLGINPQDIKNYIQVLVNGSFGLITIILSIITLIFLFRAFVTKKEFAKKKTIAIIMSAFFLIILFSELTLWIFLTQKIGATDYINPNGGVIVRDNDKKKLSNFKNGADVMSSFDNLIGPVNLQFDLSADSKYVSKYIDITGFKVDYDGDGTFDKEGINPFNDQSIIYSYDKKGTYTPKGIYIGKDKVTGDEKQIEMGLPAISVIGSVKVTETQNRLGGRKYTFDLSEITTLGNIEFYNVDKLGKFKQDNEYNGKDNIYSRVYKSAALLCLRIVNNQKNIDSCDKLFSVGSENGLNGSNIDVLMDRDPLEPLSYKFSINFGNTEKVISSYEWLIDGDSQCDNSEICEFKFSAYGKHKLLINMKEPTGNVITTEKEMDIKKPLTLSLPSGGESGTKNNSLLRVLDKDGRSTITDKYLRDLQEYHAVVSIPSEITFNSNYVKVTDSYYDLEKTEWDFDNNGKYEKNGNEIKYNFLEDKKYTVTVRYTFNSKIKNDTQSVIERIVFEAEKKNIYVKLDMKQDSDYAPTIVHFDGSASYVKSGLITKFTYDFGEGRPATDGDAKQDYKYNYPGEYIITFTVTKDDGTKDSTKKKIILKEAGKEVVVNSSVSSGFVDKQIDFDAIGTKGQIDSYLWDFGDGTKSSEPTPVHSYSTAGNYSVKLTITFTDGIIKTGNREITIK